MKTAKQFSVSDVANIGKLANIPLIAQEEEKLAAGFNSVIKVIEQLDQLNTKNIKPLHQVTGLKNVFRKDEVNKEQMLSQEQALSNAKNSYNGYFVVPRVLEA